jgi:acylphosphatase
VKAFFARITGRVQGVGFRYYTVNEARRRGIKGWVRNTRGGDVEVWAEGGEEQLNGFAQWLAAGPAGARVEEVERRDQLPRGIFRDFGVEY